MTLGGILEFVLGNTFAFVVFCSYGKSYPDRSRSVCLGVPSADDAAGGFWFTLASTLTPFFNAYGAYASDPTKPYEGLASEGFHASYG